MKVSKKFLESLKPDRIKSLLTLELDISRSTLNRWIQVENEKFAHLKVIEAITKITGLTQEEIFETN